MDLGEISSFISSIGIPAAGAFGIGWLFYALLQWMMKVIIAKLDGIEGMLVGLIDRIRMLDNDVIRMDTMLRVSNKLPPDYDRLKRKDGSVRGSPKEDSRRD